MKKLYAVLGSTLILSSLFADVEKQDKNPNFRFWEKHNPM